MGAGRAGADPGHAGALQLVGGRRPGRGAHGGVHRGRRAAAAGRRHGARPGGDPGAASAGSPDGPPRGSRRPPGWSATCSPTPASPALSPEEASVASYFTVVTERGLDHTGRYRDTLRAGGGPVADRAPVSCRRTGCGRTRPCRGSPSRRPRPSDAPVLSRDEYLAEWARWHGGTDPAGNRLVRGWLTAAYTLARPVAGLPPVARDGGGAAGRRRGGRPGGWPAAPGCSPRGCWSACPACSTPSTGRWPSPPAAPPAAGTSSTPPSTGSPRRRTPSRSGRRVRRAGWPPSFGALCWLPDYLRARAGQAGVTRPGTSRCGSGPPAWP